MHALLCLDIANTIYTGFQWDDPQAIYVTFNGRASKIWFRFLDSKTATLMGDSFQCFCVLFPVQCHLSSILYSYQFY
jgi:hypothetical protein